MIRSKNKELIRQLGMNPLKPDSFQIANEPLMNNLFLWSREKIDLHDTLQNFFGVKVRTKLVAVLLDIDLNNWVGLAASWQEHNHNGQIRIDARLTEFLLNNAFGPSPTNNPFSIKKINQLELNVLQTFMQNMENKMKESWEVDSKHPFLMDLIYLVWLVQSDEGELGKIAFAVPASFKPKKATQILPGEGIDINKLANTGIKVPIDLLVGSTKVSYSEVKSLEKEDLLIFENSDSSKFLWHLGEIGLVLPEEDHPIFLNEIGNVEELANDMVKVKHTTDDDPLSSLPLELSAEFQKVLIPLKQVLELKAGGVLPLGSVLESELILTAQGKPVAKGELVIVGNQFGMRITDLLIGTKKTGKATSSGVELDDLLTKEPQPVIQQEQSLAFEDELQDLEEN